MTSTGRLSTHVLGRPWPRRWSFRPRSLRIIAGAFAGLVACGRSAPPEGRSRQPSASVTAVASQPPGPLPSPAQPIIGPTGASVPSFAPLVRRANPAVATVKARVEQRMPFGRRRLLTEGLGTAFLYDSRGYLLTNHHVIEDATDVLVVFVDGTERKAEVIGRDRHTDIAVLKVEPVATAPLPLGDSARMEVGDWVVAIGNPFGLSHTVSAGILSAKGRTRDDVKGLDPSGYFNFLQTDASINPGNSGGPLLDVSGAVVGINSAVRANANNIGFAIPIDMVKQLLPLLVSEGRIRRSYLGVVVDFLNADEAVRLRRPTRVGAWVKQVQPGGPASRAGIQPDDIILSLNGKEVADPNELRWLASMAGVGKLALLRVARLERELEFSVSLGALPELREEEEEPR